jgi:hypothetical protein
MSEKNRKMGFWEIGANTKNALLPKAQSLFEQAQVEAFERGVKTSLTIQIDIKPPSDKEDGRFGKMSFKTSMSVPKDKSREFTTELIDGVAVGSGDSQSDLLQYSLNFPELANPENVEAFPKRNQANQ